MFSKTIRGDYQPRRLRGVLLLVFLALAIPTAAVVWQAYDQLKFEAFYQYRNQAEALAERIDSGLIADVTQAEARRFTDFAFLNVAGKLLQRSPLSEFPVTADVPGVIGYFQVGANGELSTPLLPDAGTSPDQVGVTAAEYALRQSLARDMQQILADNRLIRARPDTGGRIGRNSALDATASGTPSDAASSADERQTPREMDAARDDTDLSEAFADALTSNAAPGVLVTPSDENESYDQQVFDFLNRPERGATASEEDLEADDGIESERAQPRASNFVKLRDLNLNENLQKKSEVLERRLDEQEAEPAQRLEEMTSTARARRVEQVALPATAPPSSVEESAGAGGETDVRITTFESEIDPYEFSLLDSGHLVLFRKVWRDGQRYIQGLLIDREVFLDEALAAAYRTTTLAGMSDLIVAYQGDVVSLFRGDRYETYPVGTGELQGTLLHSARLSAPFDGLELVFSINRLPPGAGASVLAWTTVVIAVVFLLGFLALYRLGIGQIRLARQQRDFVSAISHELKTPLTSIRMYGEMLKEGWVDDTKRAQYYDYIHDESERLTRLIANVLRLAKITRNDPQLDLRVKTVGVLVNQVESKIASQVERAGFALTFLRTEPAENAAIQIDEDCFTQIMINLVDNAIKFSKDAETKTIEIGSALTADGNVLFTVRDHGPGVPKDQMKKIFKLFYRSESELTRETVGTGIGLAIVHQLTLAMNGKIDVLNRNPGAEFRITFPPAG